MRSWHSTSRTGATCSRPGTSRSRTTRRRSATTSRFARRTSVRSSPRAVGRLPILAAVFISGAALLSVELAASRVLAPFFGNSLFVWGALIGVVLAGLAAGYWMGGTLVDRFPTIRLLLGVAAAGALSVLAIPLLDGPVLRAIVSWDPGPRADPVLASVILFGPTSVLLAGVVPIAVRLRSVSVDDAGRTAGRLFALSTVGSIFGTFLTAFWLIPELGTDELL